MLESLLFAMQHIDTSTHHSWSGRHYRDCHNCRVSYSYIRICLQFSSAKAVK